MQLRSAGFHIGWVLHDCSNAKFPGTKVSLWIGTVLIRWANYMKEIAQANGFPSATKWKCQNMSNVSDRLIRSALDSLRAASGEE
jgi:G:T-mismatch repair DNA endonuclease (very short patch repair protein)